MPARGHSRATTNAAVQQAADIMFGEGGVLSAVDPQTLSEKVVEKTTVIVEQAKDNLKEPLMNVFNSAAQIAKKAVPTALAASASVQYLGGNASFASFLQPVHVRSKFLLIGTDRGATIGYPLEQYQQLSALSGFVMCENVKFDLAATATTGGATLEEQQLIKQYLENGCYIE